MAEAKAKAKVSPAKKAEAVEKAAPASKAKVADIAYPTAIYLRKSIAINKKMLGPNGATCFVRYKAGLLITEEHKIKELIDAGADYYKVEV